MEEAVRDDEGRVVMELVVQLLEMDSMEALLILLMEVGEEQLEKLRNYEAWLGALKAGYVCRGMCLS